jgi:D-inositol-3-phosphate glycosyltransferase
MPEASEAAHQQPASPRAERIRNAAARITSATISDARGHSAPRRIAMISEHASPLATLGGVDAGGQNVYVEAVARRLAKDGHRVDVFTRRTQPRVAEAVEWRRGARTIHVPAGPPADIAKEDLLAYMPPFRDWMLRYFEHQTREYDVIHANFWMSGLVAADIKARTGIPYVVTFHALGKVRRKHQGGADRFPDARFEIEERVAREADLVIAECPEDARDLVELYGASPDRLRVVPCGFDAQLFSPVDRDIARKRLGLDPREEIVLQLGRLVPRKGVDNVIEAMALVRDRHERFVRLLVVGGSEREPNPDRDPELARLMALVAERRLEDRVTFVGRRDRAELRDYYGAADIFVSTPWYEPFGITPVEAMACGVPVIGSAVGGIKSTVADGETGFLVPPRDPAALAYRIARTFERPGLLAALGRQALRRANSLYTWERVTRLLESAYEEVIVPTSGPAGIRGIALPSRLLGGASGMRATAPAPIEAPAATTPRSGA